jgi:hypothetical protein
MLNNNTNRELTIFRLYHKTHAGKMQLTSDIDVIGRCFSILCM